MEETGAPNKLGLAEAANENFSKKMGIGMWAIWRVSVTTDQTTAYIIAGIGIVGIIAQTVLDYFKIKHISS